MYMLNIKIYTTNVGYAIYTDNRIPLIKFMVNKTHVQHVQQVPIMYTYTTDTT